MALPDVQPQHYTRQLTDKVAALSQLLADLPIPPVETFPSPPTGYRLRAEFRVWHDGDKLDYVMFKPGDNRHPIPLSECPMVAERIQAVMFALLAEIRQQPVLRFKLFQVDFLSTLSGELLVSLLYHRPLEEDWVTAVAPLRERFAIDIVGRSRKRKIVLERDFVLETLTINGRSYQYKQIENSFTQPNGSVCQQMIGWALDVSRDAGGDLVEFYCGNGNFTLPLAQNFNRVVACEIAKTSVRAAQFNLALNGIDNVQVLRMSSADLTQVLQGKKQTRKAAGLELDSCRFSTVLVDPPRCGLDPETLAQVAAYPHIIYISCNPQTLRDNLTVLQDTHQITRLAAFDQFPYTHHLECGVYLTRR